MSVLVQRPLLRFQFLSNVLLFVMQFSALVFYILCSWFLESFVIQFVVTVFLVALDFWTVKNVSGRILVGLRWWNEVDEQGKSVWHFESLDQQVCHFSPFQKFITIKSNVKMWLSQTSNMFLES